MKQIHWEKYYNPFDPNPEELPQFDDVEEEENDSYQDSYDLAEVKMGKLQSFYQVPAQAIIDRMFNFWLGHTNFPITEAFKEQLDSMVGIESVDIYTPYRVRIAIGKLFEAKDILPKIDNLVKQMNDNIRSEETN